MDDSDPGCKNESEFLYFYFLGGSIRSHILVGVF